MMTKKEKKRVPELRFRGFEGEWEEKKLGDIGKFQSGTGFSNSEQGGKKGIPFYKVSDMNLAGNEYQMNISNNYVTQNQVSHLKYKVIKDNSIIFAKVGAAIFLERKRLASNFLIDNNMMAFTPKFNIDFCKYLFETIRLSKYAQVGALPSYNASDLKTIKVRIPISSYEQIKIASFLTSIDTRIQQLEKKRTLLEQYKKGVIQQIFKQEIRFKDEEGKEFPKWEEKRLGEIGVFKSGTGFSNSEQGGKEGIPFYKVSDMNLIGNEDKMMHSNNYVTQNQVSDLKYKVIKDHSIIFAKVGAAIFLERKRLASNFLIDNNMMAFTPKFNIDFCKYLFHTLRLSKYAQVGALPSYNASDLKTIKVEIPKSPEEQTKIAHFLSALDRKIAVTNEQVERTKEWKKGVLQRMFV